MITTQTGIRDRRAGLLVWSVIGTLILALGPARAQPSAAPPSNPDSDTTTGIWKEQAFAELSKTPAQVATFSRDGQVLAIAARNSVTLWDTTTGAKTATYTLPASRAVSRCMSFSADGKLLAVTSATSANRNEYVDVLDLQASASDTPERKPLKASLEHYLAGFFAADGRKLHLLSTPTGPFLHVTFREWDPTTGKVTATKLTAANIIATRGMTPGQGIRNVWQPQQDTFAVNERGVFVIVNGQHGSWFDLTKTDDPLEATLSSSVGGIPGAHGMPEGEPFTFVGFAPNSDACLMGNLSGGIYLLGSIPGGITNMPHLRDWVVRAKDLKAHPPFPSARGRRNAILSMAIPPDRKMLFSFAEDGKLCAHHVADTLKKIEEPIKPNQKGTIIIADKDMNLPLQQIGAVRLATAPIYASFAPAGDRLVAFDVINRQLRVRLWARE
ncbi:MAG: WD40 repeat domain-containing protein [Gemmataceae bacterium]